MKIKSLKIVGMLSLIIAVSGCEKNFLDINTNPNSATTSTPELILPAALANTGSNVNNNLNILGNLLSGNWAQAPDFLFYGPQETYQFTPSTYDGVWTSLYAGGLQDYKYVETEAGKAGKKNAVAISQIMQAYNYQVLVDVWGDVPFTDALQGIAVISPKYSKADEVYDGILTLINSGIANIDLTATADKPAGNDIVFAGDMNKWRRFANSLKLRVLLRQSLIPSRAAKVTAGFATLAGATFLAAGENVGTNPGYLNQAGKYSPLYTGIGFNVSGAETSNFQATRANKFAVDFLTGVSDPRLQLLYRPAKTGGAYVGVYPGTTATPTAKSANFSAIGPAALPSFTATGTALNNNGTYNGNVNGYNKPGYLMTASESFFLLAEAYLKGYLTGTAQTAYQTGIEESFKLDGSTAAAALAYYRDSTSPLVNWNAATTANRQFEAIITQKWVGNNGINGLEAWTELRRTNFPANTPYPLFAVSGGKFPLRIPYPQSEVQSNSGNIPAINIFNDRIFWDLN